MVALDTQIFSAASCILDSWCSCQMPLGPSENSKVGENSSFLMWHDIWTGSRPLIEQLGRRAVSLLESSNLSTVASIIHEGNWNLGSSTDCTLLQLRTICANIAIQSRDEILWDGVAYTNLSLSTI